MAIPQAVTVCLVVCIFSLQAQCSNSELTGSENNLPSTLNEKWQSYGCQNSAKLAKPFGKLELCLGTLVNQMIRRILQDYSPTPLPENLIIVDGKSGFEDQIRKYIETHIPLVDADNKMLGHIFDQINEYVFNPLIKYMDQFPMNVPAPEKQALLESRRAEIATFLKKYMEEQNLRKLPEEDYTSIVTKTSQTLPDGFKVALPFSVRNFESFKPWLYNYIKTYTPDLFANKPMLEKFLKQVEDIFERIEPKTFAPHNINGLDKNALLQFVKTYYPKEFEDPDFRAKLVQNYEAQPKLNVVSTSEPDYNQIRNSLLNFFKRVYPKLSIDEQFVDQFAKNLKPEHHRTGVELNVAMPQLETTTPTREVILDYIKKQVMKSTVPSTIQLSSNDKAVQTNVSATASVPEVIPTRRELLVEPTEETLSNVADPTPAQNVNIRQKILDCIKESFPHIYANKPLLAYILKQLEVEILLDTKPSPKSVEKHVRRMNEEEHVPKITVKQPDTVSDLPEDSTSEEIEMSSETEQPPRIVKKIIKYIDDGAANGTSEVVTLSHAEPTVTVVKPEEKVIEIDITPETKESSESVEKVYTVESNGSGAKVSISTGKQNPDAVVNVQVSGKSNQNPNKEKMVKLLNNIKFQPKNTSAKDYKDHEEQYKELYKNILKTIEEIAKRNKQNFQQFKTEMPKMKHTKVGEKLEAAATSSYDERMSEYITNKQDEKLASIQFPYERSFFPLMIHSYGPLYEKEHDGKPLTQAERMKMNILETTFANYKPFRQLYLKKFGTHDKVDIKSMLYNMYKLDLAENSGKKVQIDPIKNIKFQRLTNPNFKLFDDENDESQEEKTIEA